MKIIYFSIDERIKEKNDLKTLSMREQLGGETYGQRAKELPVEVKEVITMNKYCVTTVLLFLS